MNCLTTAPQAILLLKDIIYIIDAIDKEDHLKNDSKCFKKQPPVHTNTNEASQQTAEHLHGLRMMEVDGTVGSNKQLNSATKNDQLHNDSACHLDDHQDASKDELQTTEGTVAVSTTSQPTSVMYHPLKNQNEYEGKSSNLPMTKKITTTISNNDELKLPILESLEQNQNKDSFKSVTSKTEYDKEDLIQADLITEGASCTTKETATSPGKQFNSDGSDKSPVDPPKMPKSSICAPDVMARIDNLMQDEPQQDTSRQASTILADNFGSAQEYILLVKQILESQGSLFSTKNDYDSKPIQVSQQEQEQKSDICQPLEDNLRSPKTETGGERDRELLPGTSLVAPQNTALIKQANTNKKCKKHSKQKALSTHQNAQKNSQPQNPISLKKKDTRIGRGEKTPEPKTTKRHYKNKKFIKNSSDISSNSESKKLIQSTPCQTKMKSKMMGKDSKPFKKIRSGEGSTIYIQEKRAKKQNKRASNKRSSNHRCVSKSVTEDKQNISDSQGISNHLIYTNLDRGESGQLSGRSSIFQVISLTPRGSNQGGEGIPSDSSSSGGGQKNRANRRNEKVGGNSTPRQNHSDAANDEFDEEESLSLKEDELHNIDYTKKFLNTSYDCTEGACGYTDYKTKDLPPKQTYPDVPKTIDKHTGQKYMGGLIPKGARVAEHTMPQVARLVDRRRAEVSQAETAWGTNFVEEAFIPETGLPLCSSGDHRRPEWDNLKAFCTSQPLCDNCHPEKYVIFVIPFFFSYSKHLIIKITFFFIYHGVM